MPRGRCPQLGARPRKVTVCIGNAPPYGLLDAHEDPESRAALGKTGRTVSSSADGRLLNCTPVSGPPPKSKLTGPRIWIDPMQTGDSIQRSSMLPSSWPPSAAEVGQSQGSRVQEARCFRALRIPSCGCMGVFMFGGRMANFSGGLTNCHQVCYR